MCTGFLGSKRQLWNHQRTAHPAEVAQSPSYHDRECPGGKIGRMLRWERVNVRDCTCSVFYALPRTAPNVGT
jgi:hypothetical protein